MRLLVWVRRGFLRIRVFSLSTRQVTLTDAGWAVVFRLWEEKMRRNITLTLIGVALLFGSATSSGAEVRRVEMRIGGYLCGN